MTIRHSEDKLGGVIEYALSKALYNEEWLQDAADDPNIEQTTRDEVFRAVEEFVTDSLARIVQPVELVAYLQFADGSERTLTVTEPDPEDGTYCADIDGETWVRIVPTNLS